MKTLKILFILIIISIQAGATGYSHNMFVAHRKLQSGKEVIQEKVAAKKVKVPARHTVKATVQVKQAQFISTPATTLNERILEEAPVTFFETEKSDDSEQSFVNSLVSGFRCMISSFVSAAVRN